MEINNKVRDLRNQIIELNRQKWQEAIEKGPVLVSINDSLDHYSGVVDKIDFEHSSYIGFHFKFATLSYPDPDDIRQPIIFRNCALQDRWVNVDLEKADERVREINPSAFASNLIEVCEEKNAFYSD